jgi:hypothetical protein
VDEGICRRDLPNYVPVLAGQAFLLLKLTRIGGRRTATGDNAAPITSFPALSAMTVLKPRSKYPE